jgi:hypothetical protein
MSQKVPGTGTNQKSEIKKKNFFSDRRGMNQEIRVDEGEKKSKFEQRSPETFIGSNTAVTYV